MAAPSLTSWGPYLPFWNTVILLTSSWTVHVAHGAIKDANRTKLITWLGITVLLGIIFLILQAEEYIVAYNEMGLTLGSGIYGSTFFILTGFEAASWYWHFVDVVWVGLFIFVYVL